MHVVNDQYQSLRMPIGIKASQTFSEKFGLVWTPEVRLYYVREWMDDSVRVQTQFDGLQGIQFDADSGKWGRDSGRAGVGVNAQMAHRLNLRLDYDFEFYKYTSANILSATLGANW